MNNKNDPMYRVTYWVVLWLSVLLVVFFVGCGVWMVWLVTKVVLAW